MAVQTVIDEQLRTMLQGSWVSADRCLVQMHGSTGCKRHRRREQQHRCCALNEVDDSNVHLKFTLSGSGLHLSILLYHGIARKNAKYSTEQICDTSVRPGVGGKTPR
ncbi:hypothetical protein SDC9_193482 [bioreactor metagenome]|uniref:Uncharacterized protein n=1 Tax=bioreactor metagenome TaxID=1076179 RepID=A0A645IEV4_9ZZZZ